MKRFISSTLISIVNLLLSNAFSPQVSSPSKPFRVQLNANKKGSNNVIKEKSTFTFPNMDNIFSMNSNNNKKVESEKERLMRLKREELELLELNEKERAIQVQKDKLPYLLLFALQFLPLIGTDRILSVLYFWGVAVCTVYVGGRQVTLDEERVTKENALGAPIGASISIGLLYILIKNGLDPTSLYAIAVSLFGALAISDIGVPILRNIFPEDFATKNINIPKKVSRSLGIGTDELPLDGLVTLALGILCTGVYWAPVVMEQKFLVSNFIAWALAMTSLGVISLGSFQTGAILLAGLFFYDIFWVFGTDVMMTVATKVEAPVKFLYTAPPPPPGAEPREYPFSVLGLGDVVIPGLFVRFMGKLDQTLQPQRFSYFNASTIAYAAGLSICFVVNEITHAGQPALLYLDPACVGSALACGAVNGQLNEVWNFEEEISEGDAQKERN